jgi:hypothetical protein
MRFVKHALIIMFVNLEVQYDGISIEITEFTGRDMICDAGLCTMQGYIYQHGFKGFCHR